MRNVFGSMVRIFAPVRMAQIATGVILYLGAWFGILTIGSDRPNIGLYSILLPAACVIVTVLWYRVAETRQNWPRPEFGLIFGLLFFVPLIFVLTAPSIWGKPPPTLMQAVEFLVASYSLFPASVSLISAYSGLLGALCLSVVAIWITGRRIIKRRPDGLTTGGEPAGGSALQHS
jgi:multisubunit Na+/H+ antiporter MnhB subunit